MLICFSLSLRNEAMFHTAAAANITSQIRLERSQEGCRGKDHPGSLVYQNQRDGKVHLPSAVQVALTNTAILGQGRWAEPEGWDTLVVAVPLIAIVTMGTISHECIAVPIHWISLTFQWCFYSWVHVLVALFWRAWPCGFGSFRDKVLY